MKSYVFLKKWNLYANRIVKYIENRNFTNFIQSYQDLYVIKNNINYNPGNGVSSSLVLNWMEDWTPTYLLVVDESDNIISTWFVMELKRTAKGQYVVSIKRDSINDFYNDVITATTYIDRCHIPTTNPAIYNSEGFSFNQIKKEERLLKENCAWIVGYIARNAPVATGSQTGVEISASIANTWDYTSENFPIPELLPSFTAKKTTYVTTSINIAVQSLINNKSIYIESPLQIGADGAVYYDSANTNFIITATNPTYAFSTTKQQHALTLIDEWIGSNEYNISQAIAASNPYSYTLEELNSINGQIIKIGERLGRIDVKPSKNSITSTGAIMGISPDVALSLENLITEYSDILNVGTDINAQFLNFTKQRYEINLIEVNTGATYSTTLFSSQRQPLHDAPYDMFALPYGNITISKGPSTQYTLLQSVGLGFASALFSQLGEGTIYDLQLLPYCPMNLIKSAGNYDIASLTEHKDYDLVKNATGEVQSIIFYPAKSTFTKIIPVDMFPTNPLKIENETAFVRLCSPNYSGMFELNLAKNNGIKDIFVYCTYKPYNPYIQLSPEFKNLYGENFGDIRGLVCEGDFSLPQITDAFATYEVRNKNYENLHKRDIQSMDTNRKYDRISQISSIALSTTKAGIASAAGASVSGVDPITGAAIGSITSLATGIADYALSEARFKEARSYKQDVFNYQIDNIKALPYNLTKSSSFTATNKIFPFIEYYDCTEKEKELLTNYLKLNGMTANFVDKIKNYLTSEPQFIQGTILRFDDFNGDETIMMDIINELKSGVYI